MPTEEEIQEWIRLGLCEKCGGCQDERCYGMNCASVGICWCKDWVME